MGTNPVVSLNNVSKYYKLYQMPKDRLREALSPFGKSYHRPFCALKDVSIRIHSGEVVGIVGRNGAGKSTLLKIICNVIQPTSGNVKVHGTVSALLELGAGFNPEFTGIENVYFYGALTGFTKAEIDERLHDILAFADIGEYVHQPVKRYSSGMKARLAFAAAISIAPDILVVDEVLAVGDALFRRKCYSKIEQFMNEGKTILFVSHDVTAVSQLCNRAMLLDQGELILEGPTKLVTTQYERFVYAKPQDASKIRSEILALDDHSCSRLMTSALRDDGKPGTHSGEADRRNLSNKDNKTTPVALTTGHKRSPKPLFIPGLKSKSTVRHKDCGVAIDDIKIATLDGTMVNSLVMNQEYIYSYIVKFNIDAENIRFGMRLKTTEGFEIEGALESGLDGMRSLPKAQKHDKYLVQWYFNCILIPGTYFTNAGVTGEIDGKEMILARVVDGLVFKVQEIERRGYIGIAHLYSKARITRIEDDRKNGKIGDNRRTGSGRIR